MQSFEILINIYESNNNENKKKKEYFVIFKAFLYLNYKSKKRENERKEETFSAGYSKST